jgi:hypothetical protein
MDTAALRGGSRRGAWLWSSPVRVVLWVLLLGVAVALAVGDVGGDSRTSPPRWRLLVGAALTVLVVAVQVRQRWRLARGEGAWSTPALTIMALAGAGACLTAPVAVASVVGYAAVATVARTREAGWGWLFAVPPMGALAYLNWWATSQVIAPVAGMTPCRQPIAEAVLREGLTNSVRHAPGLPIAVRTSATTIEVRTLGEIAAAAPSDHVSGHHGLRGLRDRVEASGGRLAAGPSDDGWRVTAEWAP